MKLFFYDNRWKQQLDHYTLNAEQLRFTGHPDEAIILANHDPERHPIVAVENGQIVNFFVLHEKNGVKPYSCHPHAILLRTFSTDFHQQGKGYAKQCLKLLPGFVQTHFTGIEQIVLAVNVQNIAAQRLYKKSGFKDEGVRKMGKKGELMILNYYFSSILRKIE